MAVAIERGTATTIAPVVTSRVPTIRGRIPKTGGSKVGFQVSPVRNGQIPYWLKSGRPSQMR
ncbi:hypothetical protein DSECCO2_565730 [anaerobic digester metagenome]